MCRRGRYSRRTWISCLLRWITEYLYRLPSYNEADLFLGLRVFGVKNRIDYELAQFFSHNAYSVLLLQPIRFSVPKIQTLGERFQRPALSAKQFHPIDVFDGRLKRQREIFVVFGEINFRF